MSYQGGEMDRCYRYGHSPTLNTVPCLVSMNWSNKNPVKYGVHVDANETACFCLIKLKNEFL